jgi:hypothetical protein
LAAGAGSIHNPPDRERFVAGPSRVSNRSEPTSLADRRVAGQRLSIGGQPDCAAAGDLACTCRQTAYDPGQNAYESLLGEGPLSSVAAAPRPPDSGPRGAAVIAPPAAPSLEWSGVAALGSRSARLRAACGDLVGRALGRHDRAELLKLTRSPARRPAPTGCPPAAPAPRAPAPRQRPPCGSPSASAPASDTVPTTDHGVITRGPLPTHCRVRARSRAIARGDSPASLRRAASRRAAIAGSSIQTSRARSTRARHPDSGLGWKQCPCGSTPAA